LRVSNSSAFLLATILFFPACSSPQPTPASPQEAITEFQAAAGFLQTDLTFVESTTMGNSPRGYLPVDLYQDSDGRQYFVDTRSNTLVEMDARNLLGTHTDVQADLLDQAALEARAEALVRSVIPQFQSLQNELTFEAGGKVDNYFFSWKLPIEPGATMWPFIQVAYTTQGELFAFYNTVTLP
jgi:hypothetical protein